LLIKVSRRDAKRLKNSKTNWGRAEQRVEATDKLCGTATYISIKHDDVKTGTEVNPVKAANRATRERRNKSRTEGIKGAERGTFETTHGQTAAGK
jgi:hypothetical protein